MGLPLSRFVRNTSIWRWCLLRKLKNGDILFVIITTPLGESQVVNVPGNSGTS